jgi:capsid portal protein
LILEAERVDSQAIGAAGAGAAAQARMKIEIVPLTDSQQKDALFQAYDERNADKIGQAFRLPRLLRGDVRDFNRSTAEGIQRLPRSVSSVLYAKSSTGV